MEQILQFQWWQPTEWSTLVWVVVPPLAKAVVLAMLTWYLAGAARGAFEHATHRSGADASFRLIIGRLVYLTIFIIGTVTVLDVFGVPLSTLITVLGVVGIGISLALQDILKNFFAGTYLLFERPFRIGDLISVKDQRGIIETIGIRTTTLRTSENVEVMVPNAMFFAEIVSNRTYERQREEAAAPAASRDQLTRARSDDTSPRSDALAPDRASAMLVAGLHLLGYSPAATWIRLRGLSTTLLSRVRIIGR